MVGLLSQYKIYNQLMWQSGGIMQYSDIWIKMNDIK